MKKRIKSELELKLDDDGKLRRKYINKCHNAIKEGLCVELTFEEFMQLMVLANIVSSDLGFSCGKIMYWRGSAIMEIIHFQIADLLPSWKMYMNDLMFI